MWKLLNSKCSIFAFLLLAFYATQLSANVKDAIASEHFSHEILDSLLQANVHGGLINYYGFDTPQFAHYFKLLEAAKIDSWEPAERLAFFLNAYNAMTIKAVLNRPGLKMANNFSGFFTADTFVIAGKPLVLQSLRDEMSRSFNTPLLHFGAMLPAMGAPRIPSRAYRAKNIINELAKLARQYFRSESGCVLDIGAKTLRLSWICHDYRKDFEKSGKSLLEAVLPYLEDKTAAFAAVYKDQIQIDFLPFDWRVNARRDGRADVEGKPYYTRKDTINKTTKTMKNK